VSTSVFVAGVGMTPFGKHMDTSVKQATRQAVKAALADAQSEPASLQGAFFGNSTQGHMDGQHMIRGELALGDNRWFPSRQRRECLRERQHRLPLAVTYVRAGAADVVLAVGAERCTRPTKRAASVRSTAPGMCTTTEAGKALLPGAAGSSPPPGSVSTKPYSVFMDIYAAMGRMHSANTVRRSAVRCGVGENHAHSVHNPLAQYREAYTVEQVLTSAAPINVSAHAPDVLADQRRRCGRPSSAAKLGLPVSASRATRAMRVLASVLQTGSDRPAEALDRQSVRQGFGQGLRAGGRRTTGCQRVRRCTTPPRSAKSFSPRCSGCALPARVDRWPNAARRELVGVSHQHRQAVSNRRATQIGATGLGQILRAGNAAARRGRREAGGRRAYRHRGEWRRSAGRGRGVACITLLGAMTQTIGG